MAGGGTGNYGQGGAAAAAADLARARRSLGIERPENERRLHETASDVFRDADVLLRALRTYEAGHPRIEDFLSRLHGRLTSYLVLAPELAVTLQPRTVQGESGTLFEAARIEDNPWFPLFSDGVRRLTFIQGIDARETFDIFNTILNTTGSKVDPSSEEDVVTLLWERSFPHLRFSAVDSFVLGIGDNVDGARIDALHALINNCTRSDLRGAELVGESYAQSAVVRRMGAAAYQQRDLTFLAAENLSFSSELPASPRAASRRLIQVRPEHVAALARTCHGDGAEVGRYFGALLAALREREGEDRDVTLASLGELCSALIASDELRKTSLMLAHIHRAVPTMTDVASRLIGADDVARLVASLQKHRDTDLESHALELVRSLSPAHADAVLEATRTVEVARVREQILEIASAWGLAAANAAAERMQDSSTDVARDFLALLQRVGTSAHAALERATWTAPGDVRADALRVLFSVAPHEVSCPRAERGLREVDPRLRRLCLDFLVRVRPPRAASWIKARIDDEGFAELDGAERKRLYLAFGRTGGRRASQWLLEKLSQSNKLGRAKIDEERALAAWTLAQVRFRDAKPRLQQLSESRMSRGVVKDACLEALRVIDTPSEELAPPPPDPGARRPARRKRPSDMDQLLAGYLGDPKDSK